MTFIHYTVHTVAACADVMCGYDSSGQRSGVQ